MEYAETSLMEDFEEEKSDEKKKEIIDELLKQVPYNLSVALIKISQLNNYAPLSLEKYYENILPAFEYLRRTDGSKYRTHSKTTVRSAMVSSKLYRRTSDNLYELNLSNGIAVLEMIKQKKTVNENDFENGLESKEVSETPKEKPKPKKKVTIELPPPEKTNTDKEFVGKKRKYTKRIKKDGFKIKIDKYVRTFELLKKLLTISIQDKALYAQLDFDFSNINENNLEDRKISIDKIIGMLTVFKYFKVFLEKNFNAIRVHDSLREKVRELSSEANYIEAIFRSEE